MTKSRLPADPNLPTTVLAVVRCVDHRSRVRLRSRLEATVRASGGEPRRRCDPARRPGCDAVLEPLGFARLTVQELSLSDDSVLVDGQVPSNVGRVLDGDIGDRVSDAASAGVLGDPDHSKLADRQNPGDHRPHRVGRAEPSLVDRAVRRLESGLPVPPATAVSNVRLDINVALTDVGVPVVDIETESGPRRARFVLVVGVRAGTEPFESNPGHRLRPEERDRQPASRRDIDFRPGEALRELGVGERLIGDGCRVRRRTRRRSGVIGGDAPTPRESEEKCDCDREEKRDRNRGGDPPRHVVLSWSPGNEAVDDLRCDRYHRCFIDPSPDGGPDLRRSHRGDNPTDPSSVPVRSVGRNPLACLLNFLVDAVPGDRRFDGRGLQIARRIDRPGTTYPRAPPIRGGWMPLSGDRRRR